MKHSDASPVDGLAALAREIIACERCPRLRAHCREIARVKRRAYRDEEYWGRPVPGFGDPRARLLIVGLAPGAHGANRTGRMFTGDASGDFLYRALWETGFASQPDAVSRDDGLTLRDAWITAPVRCAPPDNKPSRQERDNCAFFLEKELVYLPHCTVVVALGRFGQDAYLSVLQRQGRIRKRSAYPFGHGVEHDLPDGKRLLSSYHPSRQNTQTGRLTREMLRAVFERARTALS